MILQRQEKCQAKEFCQSCLAGKNECELCEKGFAHQKHLLRHQRSTHGEKMFECHLYPYNTARKDNLTSHQKVHTKSASDQALNRKRKNETEIQLSPKKINLPKETQHPSNLKCKIAHQDPSSSPTYPRLEKIIDPGNDEQLLKYPEKQVIMSNY